MIGILSTLFPPKLGHIELGLELASSGEYFLRMRQRACLPEVDSSIGVLRAWHKGAWHPAIWTGRNNSCLAVGRELIDMQTRFFGISYPGLA